MHCPLWANLPHRTYEWRSGKPCRKPKKQSASRPNLSKPHEKKPKKQKNKIWQRIQWLGKAYPIWYTDAECDNPL